MITSRDQYNYYRTVINYNNFSLIKLQISHHNINHLHTQQFYFRWRPSTTCPII